MARRLAVGGVAALLAAGGIARASWTGDETPPVSWAPIPPSEAANVYKIAHPDIDYPAQVDLMADTFNIPDDQDRDWKESRTEPGSYSGGAGNAGIGNFENDDPLTGEIGLFKYRLQTVNWTYTTPLWTENSPHCWECPPLRDWTSEQALAATHDYMTATNQNYTIDWDTSIQDTTIRVRGDLLVDGVPIENIDWSFVYGPAGELYFATGYLVDVTTIGTVRRLPPNEFLATLKPGTYDPDIPPEPTLVSQRLTNGQLLIVPAYNITTPGGLTHKTIPAYDPTTGPQPLPNTSNPPNSA